MPITYNLVQLRQDTHLHVQSIRNINAMRDEFAMGLQGGNRGTKGEIGGNERSFEPTSVIGKWPGLAMKEENRSFSSGLRTMSGNY